MDAAGFNRDQNSGCGFSLQVVSYLCQKTYQLREHQYVVQRLHNLIPHLLTFQSSYMEFRGDNKGMHWIHNYLKHGCSATVRINSSKCPCIPMVTQNHKSMYSCNTVIKIIIKGMLVDELEAKTVKFQPTRWESY
ncbi:unnamed protein product [Camellia sinensis]